MTALDSTLISRDVPAALHHDHPLVPADRADEEIEVLRTVDR